MHSGLRRILTALLIAVVSCVPAACSLWAQVTGGQRAFEFLRLPQNPHLSALGGINVSNPDQDISMGLQNPSLMRPGLHNQLALNYNAYYAGIGIANLQYGYHLEKINTSLVAGIQYLNYGSFTQTDAAGNDLGTFRASDYAVTVGASRAYLNRWRYGAAVKMAHSSLMDKKALGVLADVGVTYYDTANLITAGIVAKNIGFMAQRYNPGHAAEPMPFDLQIGFTKRFAHLPLRFNATAHHLYEWDVRYNNPADINRSSLFGTVDSSALTKGYFGDKLFRHLIFGADILLGQRIVITGAYNHLRRGELSLADRTALAGFSFGATINLNKFTVQYARSYYHLAGATNEFGLTLSMNKAVGIGKATERWRWNKIYPDWNQ